MGEIHSKAKPKAAKRPSRVVNGEPAATNGAAGNGERFTATKSRDSSVAAKTALVAGGNPPMITGRWGRPSEVLLDPVVEEDGAVRGVANPGRQNAPIRLTEPRKRWVLRVRSRLMKLNPIGMYSRTALARH